VLGPALATRGGQRIDAQRRVYRLDPGPLRKLDAWLAPYRQMWNTSLDALARELDTMQEEDLAP